MASRFSFFCFLFASSLVASSLTAIVAAQESAESQKFVLSLDHSNFSDTVSKHDFIVVEFFAPWCGHCKTLEPEYETAASVLSSHDPPIVLAKVDASDEANKEIAKEFQIQGFPTIKILRNGGKSVQDYNGPRDSHRIVQYLKRQSGPASVELKSTVDATNLIGEKKIVIVGIFPQFSGEEFTNYTVLSEKLRSDYDLGHTLDAKLLPRGETSVTGPLVRLFKSFDELFVDFEDFDVDAMMKFIDESSVPLVTIFDNEPSNEIFVTKFFDREIERVMLFYNFSSEDAQSFESNYRHIAEQYKGKDIGFLIGDLNTSEEALKYFGIKDDQVPAIFIESTAQQNYLKRNVDPNQIAAWFKEYKAGNVLPYKKSEPIPEQNDEPVKVVVHDSIQDMVFNSRKNVLLEFYAPWCQHCKTLAPILEEVALSYEADPNVIIAKLDATANDFPTATFDVKGFPTMYFVSATGKLSGYNGARTKDSIVEFIEKNRDVVSEEDSNTKDEQIESDAKDEL